MKRFIAYILLLTATCSLSMSVSAQIYDADGQYVDTIFHDHINRQADDFVIVSLCVADPTDWRDDVSGINGHAFIRLQCPVFDFDYCFSYENEPIDENVWRFIMGDLKMGMFCYETESQVEVFTHWNRTIHEYQLNLPPEAKQRLWEIMDNHVNNGVKLPIDMYRRGCAISLVHFVTEALGDKKIEYAEWPDDIQTKSRYQILEDNLEAHPWLRLCYKLTVLDKRFDKPCSNEDKLVIPAQLAEVWQTATLDGQPLAVYVGDLTHGSQVVVEKTWFTPSMALALLILLVGGLTSWLVRRKHRNAATV